MSFFAWMKKTSLSFLFCFFSLFPNFCSAGLVNGTLVATPRGLVLIEELKIGDKVLTYNLEEPNETKAIIEVAITNILKHRTDTAFTFYTSNNGWIDSSSHQLFFSLTPRRNVKNVPIVDFVESQEITTDFMLFDDNLECIPITRIYKMNLSGDVNDQYVETVTKNKRNRTTCIERSYITVDIYSLEVEAPYTFLVSDRSYNEVAKPRLLLTHNGFPALALGGSFVFDASLSSASFSHVSVGIGAACFELGPVGWAIGIVGAGWLGYNYWFKKNEKESGPTGYLELAESNNQNRKKDPKKEEDPDFPRVPPYKRDRNKSRPDAKPHVEFSAKEFEKNISRIPANERVGVVEKTAEQIAEKNNLSFDRDISRINHRDVYRDAKGTRYSVDTQHGRFEVCNKQGTHLKEVDFNFNQTKGPDLSGRHDLRMG